jgi:hypothetical protein
MKTNNIVIVFVIGLLLGSTAWANEIYIDQVGDNLDLDISQSGTDNQFGDSTTDVSLNGADMTFSITQTGNNNDIAAVIKGTNYTGTWSFVGDYNTVDLLCSSSATGDCDTVTLNITTTGDSNTFDFDIGETQDGSSSNVSFTVTGDNNIIASTIDGVSAAVSVTLDNSASLATTSANSDEGNNIDIDIAGDGDTVGHTVTLGITGGGSTYTIDQSGINDNTVNATFNGDSQDVDITQSD